MQRLVVTIPPKNPAIMEMKGSMMKLPITPTNTTPENTETFMSSKWIIFFVIAEIHRDDRMVLEKAKYIFIEPMLLVPDTLGSCKEENKGIMKRDPSKLNTLIYSGGYCGATSYLFDLQNFLVIKNNNPNPDPNKKPRLMKKSSKIYF